MATESLTSKEDLPEPSLEVLKRVAERERQLEEFRALKPRWDGYNAETINAACIDKARDLLAILPGDWTPVPVADGSMQIELHADGFELEMSIRVAETQEQKP